MRWLQREGLFQVRIRPFCVGRIQLEACSGASHEGVGTRLVAQGLGVALDSRLELATIVFTPPNVHVAVGQKAEHVGRHQLQYLLELRRRTRPQPLLKRRRGCIQSFSNGRHLRSDTNHPEGKHKESREGWLLSALAAQFEMEK